MAFLLLDCVKKRETGSERQKDLYVISLEEQYEVLQRKYFGLRRLSFEMFVQVCCNTALEKRYYLSMPGILRDGLNNGYYNNIVLRPESDPGMSEFLPADVDVIFIGDISMRYGEFVVKGFELLDKNVHKYAEKEISGVACCAFIKKTIRRDIFTPAAAVSDYGFQLTPGCSLFTRDVILELTTEKYPVPNPEHLIDSYNKWEEYITFRKYYLEQLGKDSIQIADCDVIEAFGIKKSLYDKNKEKYQDYLLDGFSEFEKNEMILLEKEVDDAEAFPLVRVIVEKNRNELFQECDAIKPDKPAFEMRLFRFTREMMAIVSDIRIGERIKTKRLVLDDRYRLYHKDVSSIALREAEEKIDAENREKRQQFKEESGKFDAKELGEFVKKLEAEKKETLETLKKELEKNLNTEEASASDQMLRRYYIYFKIVRYDADEVKEKVECIKKSVNPKFLKYNRIAEEQKIKRQETALHNFFQGYVKNPFLAMYLFSPDKIRVPQSMGEQEIVFFSDHLNDAQKEAVKKALKSDSVFLIQGPPGTGKTEVIAEITAQFAKMGKRVLISSQTHKAIDNVFDRLPKISEIRPLRLIPSISKKETTYAPEHLVENFYLNISASLIKEIEKFKKFSEYKEKFEENFKKLQLQFETLEKDGRLISEAQTSITLIEQDIKNAREHCDLERETLRELTERSNDLSVASKKIDTLIFQVNDTDEDVTAVRKKLEALLKQYPCFIQSADILRDLYNADITQIKAETAVMEGNPEAVSLRAEHEKIREEIKLLTDEYTGEALPGKEEEHRELQGKFIAIGKKLKEKQRASGINLNDTTASKLLDRNCITPGVLNTLPLVIAEIKQKILEIKSQHTTEISKKVLSLKEKILKQEDSIKEIEKKIKQKRELIAQEKETCGYEEFQKNERVLRTKIATFFKDFDILRDPNSDDISQTLERMAIEWRRLETEYREKESENREKIPMYQKIVNYLIKGGVPIEDDRNQYTRALFDNVNVYGMTSTSRDNFTAKNIASFEKYGIEQLDIKRQSIDVVIIDEVSKSSLLDVLIPVLYGKTVILVGDHRQLPPIYDLKHLKDEDFEELEGRTQAEDSDEDAFNEEADFLETEYPEDENLEENSKTEPRYNKKINEKFTKLYEESFFKTLIYAVPDTLRARLNKQYRCHEDIMRVFNHFYMNASRKGALELGAKSQNDQKQHNISVIINGRSIIEPNKHIYFIDCSNSYETFSDGSTSASNNIEAESITVLAKCIDESLNNYPNEHTKRNKDDRLSMGIICTYGDQVRLIKNMLKRNQLKNINDDRDERFIISTVDDFQGDERDIIFVSMVRNPEPKNRRWTRAEFVKQFERINVALSRARRMLVIAGSKDFLYDVRIDLPDMDGNKNLDLKNYPVYREIINTIAVYGNIIHAKDILEDRN